MIMNKIMACAGIDSPINVQSIMPQSPLPVSTVVSTFDMGMVCTQYSSPGPQAGGWADGA